MSNIVQNEYLSTLLTNAIHEGNAQEVQRILSIITDVGGTISVEPIYDPLNGSVPNNG